MADRTRLQTTSDGALPRPGWRRLHLGWAVPLAAGTACFVGGVLATEWLSSRADRNAGFAFAAFGTTLVWIVCPVIALIFTIRGLWRLFRAWRSSHGHFTKSEVAEQASRAAYNAGWAHAIQLRTELLAGRVPAQPAQHWAVAPNAGEVFLVDGAASYARYYGQDVYYNQSSAFAFGRPAFVAGVLAINAIANANARSRAEQLARAQWREHQQLQVIATNQRVICEVAGRGWLSFYYSAMSAVYPEAEKWTIVCQFTGEVAPLMLVGPSVPAICTVVIAGTHGARGVREHPGLQALGG